ncbi:uncharacterized protein [Amphiura filiformis]|uniref:uncharacterized protein n=1 Tax=Amphiura filiformis TaxID=82378 RepID=UPI003B21A468
MGLLLILTLTITALTCWGTGNAQDVYVNACLQTIFTAPANTLKFTEVFTHERMINSVDIDDSGSFLYFSSDSSILKYNLKQGSGPETLITLPPTDTGARVIITSIKLDGTTLYYFTNQAYGFSLDLTAQDLSASINEIWKNSDKTGYVMSKTDIKGRDMYISIMFQNKVIRLNLDTLEETTLSTISSIKSPTAVTVDDSENALYYGAMNKVDYFFYINRYDLGSNTETEMVQYPLSQQMPPKSIALFDGGLLYTSFYFGLFQLASNSNVGTAVETGITCTNYNMYTDVIVVNDDMSACEEQHTVSYTHDGRMLNSDFVFPFGELAAESTEFTISIKGTAFAYILLSPTNNPADDAAGAVGIPKIEIGRKDNTKSAYLCNSNNAFIHSTLDSLNILSDTDYRDYHFSFANGHVEVSFDGNVFISADMECLGDVRYIGIGSGRGHDADWKYCQ